MSYSDPLVELLYTDPKQAWELARSLEREDFILRNAEVWAGRMFFGNMKVRWTDEWLSKVDLSEIDYLNLGDSDVSDLSPLLSLDNLTIVTIPSKGVPEDQIQALREKGVHCGELA